MPLSKRYLDTNTKPVFFDPDELGAALESACGEAVFAYLMGSSVSGEVKPHSDLDLAFYLTGKPELDLYDRVFDVCEGYVGGIRVDVGMLNGSEPVYRFEALKGRLLFCRDEEVWLRFYSVTCREYEHQMFHYEKQLLYRREAVNNEV